MNRRARWWWLGVALVASLAAAQAYPSRPIRLIIPWPPGGATDVVFRLWAPTLAEHLGQHIVVDNRAGASSIIGLDIVAKSRPDGYTLGAVNISFGVNPFLVAKMPFDSQKDFLPVSQTALVPMVLTVHPSVPARSVKELIALARGKPGSLRYASAGNASASHLVTELFLDATGANILHVPYKGGGPQVVSMLGGEVSVAFIPIPNSLPHIQAGKMVALGVSTLKRHSTLASVPTIAEAIGVRDFQVSEWHGLVVPAGTPQAVIERLSEGTVQVLRRPEVRDRIERAGAMAVGSTPQEMRSFVQQEFARWSGLVRKAGIRAE